MAIVEYTRARDAQRALIVFENYNMNGRNMNIKLAKEQRNLPQSLQELGRPLPESQCQDICVNNYQINPFEETTLFVANLPFETTQDDIKHLFYLIAEAKKVIILTEGGRRDGRSRGICVVKVSTGIDAIQCVNVFHECKFQDRTIKVRLDRDHATPSSAPTATGMIPAAPGQPGYGFGAPPVQPGHFYPPAGQPMAPAPGAPPVYGAFPGQPITSPVAPGPGAPLGQAPVASGFGAPPASTTNYPPPSFGAHSSHNAPASISTQNRDSRGRDNSRSASNAATDPDTVKQLAAVLGVDPEALQKLRESSQKGRDDSNEMRDRSPIRPERKRNDNSRNNQQQSVSQGWGGQQPNKPQIQAQAQINSSMNQNNAQNNTNGNSNGNDGNWVPTTKDTVYISNIPRSLDENRLRSMMNTCGGIKFVDFPLNPDNTPVGYAYVRFASEFEKCIARAVGMFDNMNVDGQHIVVGQY